MVHPLADFWSITLHRKIKILLKLASLVFVCYLVGKNLFCNHIHGCCYHYFCFSCVTKDMYFSDVFDPLCSQLGCKNLPYKYSTTQTEALICKLQPIFSNPSVFFLLCGIKCISYVCNVFSPSPNLG